MNYLIIGGSKSGKSDTAEKISLSLDNKKVVYIATMRPYDEEDKRRIKAHIKKRDGYNFVTIEKQKDVNEIVTSLGSNDTVLLDSITSLLTNEMFVGKHINKNCAEKICSDLIKIMNKVKNTIIVSDYIFNDAIEYDEITENYRKQLGIINRKIASYSEKVIECSFGMQKVWKDC